jgi:hypothetical protein
VNHRQQNGKQVRFRFLLLAGSIPVAVEVLKVVNPRVGFQAGSEGKSVGAIWAANSLNTRTGGVR